ncbi:MULTISPECIES: AAA family ATPase [Microbacterium]|jgi:hypothetical protein|uniref:AAA family ATPase n=1 Tax=Microbacterium TaxID=33882 RepID=UPI0023DAE250|nr:MULTISPECIES: AAA family ATPase [Microbacterium]MDF2045634.1 AAA family ATPase [Microbacterium sp. Kw_RZR3]MDF2919938.1 rca [Microbacterium sp.]MDQ1074887.1 hypothetical protein [Microbacterium sp. SORGH_AS_0969]MDQ1115112.1 hypothetical protein [Microbacterium testaceum]
MTSPVPHRLRERIELHLFRNLAAAALRHIPLILCIEGEPGSGKTFAVDAVAGDSGVKVFSIAGDQLESPNAGYPAQLIRDTYREAGEALRGGALGAALVIHDIDTALGSWGANVQYTMNRQMVNNALMNLSDSPTIVEGFDTRRVPIILTGNDFSLLHAPVMRTGRSDLFRWEPTVAERTFVVADILPAGLEGLAEVLVTNHPTQPVSFFADAVAFAQNTSLSDAIAKRSLTELLALIRDGHDPIVPPPTVESILRSAEVLASSRRDSKEAL